jgi:hypothetical protein
VLLSGVVEAQGHMGIEAYSKRRKVSEAAPMSSEEGGDPVVPTLK